jgi:tryptophanyl-tRNA synthetase
VKDRVLSGMQASGRLHLGNLIGALSNWVRLQDQYDCHYFVADWHALTTMYADPSFIRESTKDILINFLAAGLDPEKCMIFLQSRIPEHAELHLLLSMITLLAGSKESHLQRKTAGTQRQRFINLWVPRIPLLQTADILIYRAKYVPVGIDQVPHLEISRRSQGVLITSTEKHSPNLRPSLQSLQKWSVSTGGKCQRVMTMQYFFQIVLKRFNRRS